MLHMIDALKGFEGFGGVQLNWLSNTINLRIADTFDFVTLTGKNTFIL